QPSTAEYSSAYPPVPSAWSCPPPDGSGQVGCLVWPAVRMAMGSPQVWQGGQRSFELSPGGALGSSGGGEEREGSEGCRLLEPAPFVLPSGSVASVVREGSRKRVAPLEPPPFALFAPFAPFGSTTRTHIQPASIASLRETTPAFFFARLSASLLNP